MIPAKQARAKVRASRAQQLELARKQLSGALEKISEDIACAASLGRCSVYLDFGTYIVPDGYDLLKSSLTDAGYNVQPSREGLVLWRVGWE